MHMGVGMYQHDIPERILHASLDSVMTECVSFVGVDINSASEFVLRLVPENFIDGCVFIDVLGELIFYVCFAPHEKLCRNLIVIIYAGFRYSLFLDGIGWTSQIIIKSKCVSAYYLGGY